MTEQLIASRAIRVRQISSKGWNVAIFRENPLFEYFSSDARADSVLLENGKVLLLGPREVDPNFISSENKDYCIFRPFFSFREGKSCSFGADEWFGFPLSEEYRFIVEQRKKISKEIESVVSEMSVEDTEMGLSKSLKSRLCMQGLSLYYDPVVAFDQNTKNVWNRPGNNTLKRIMYIEVACRSEGLTVLFSNSFLATNEEEYINRYKESIEAQEIVKKTFIDGNTTSQISSDIDRYRNENLYLTTPLFPFNYHAIPGTNETIKTGDTAVFDLWSNSPDFSFRRKIVAMAGSYRATVF